MGARHAIGAGIVAPTPAHQLLPFEKALLDATAAALRPAEAQQLVQQIACINRVQRVADWKRIELRSQRWGWQRWPAGVLFARRDAFRLATLSCRFGAHEAVVDVWAADGHVASLQATHGLSGLSIAGPLQVIATAPGV